MSLNILERKDTHASDLTAAAKFQPIRSLTLCVMIC